MVYFCSMCRHFTFTLLFGFIFFTSLAQKTWDLKTCVTYAMSNNLSVKQSEVQANFSVLTLKQSKFSQIPGLNLATSTAFNTGNNQDPTTYSRVTENYLSAGMQLQSSAQIFNFYAKKNTIAANNWEAMASMANYNKIKYDVALSTANAYLQVLLAKEQQKITELQIQQTRAQLDNTRKIVDAGALPELNATQLEAQIAQDSSNYITATGNVNLSILSLKALLSIDAGSPFEVETPPISSIPLETIADLQPEFVYQEALKNQPQQQGNDFRLKAALKNAAAAKAAMYPSLSAFGSIGTNFLSFEKKAIYNKVVTGYQSTGLIVDAGSGVIYDVQSPVLNNGAIIGYIKPGSFSSQFKDNLRKSLGLSLSIPIFNGSTAKINYERSRLNINSVKLQQEQDNLKLKQDIYQAYNAAITSFQKFNASNKSVAANEKALEFANKRFAIGALSTFDLISTQNNLLRARLESSINQFDYVFKMKVLEFYKGAGLKL